MIDELVWIDTFGESNWEKFNANNQLLLKCRRLEDDFEKNCKELSSAFAVDISITDVIVISIAGILCGVCNGLFKSYVPQTGKYKHKHGTTRSAVDYKVPNPGVKGHQGLHRQIGPGHDLFRINEALQMMNGEKNDFKLWGKSAAEIMGGVLHPGNMKVDDFLAKGGFKIPANPKAELLNHLIIDFFTKTSLPIPGTSYIADHSEFFARLMMELYGEGLNLKNLAGNSVSTALMQLFIDSYIFFSKVMPETRLIEKVKEQQYQIIKESLDAFKRYKKSSEYSVIEMIGQGSLFLLDTVVSVSSKNYAGLLELNYFSLLVFGRYSIKYILEVNKKMDVLKFQSATLINDFEGTNNQFYAALVTEYKEAFSNQDIADSLDPLSLLNNVEETNSRIETLDEIIERRKKLMENWEDV